MSAPTHNPLLHRFALLAALATLLLICFGGLVTSHGVGMAVPDWPNTYGYNMFFFPISQWIGGIFYEHTHRLIASAVGMLTGILAFWLYGRKARPLMRWLGLGLLVLGVVSWLGFPKRWADALVLEFTGVALFGFGFIWPRCEPSPKWLRRLGVSAFFAVVIQGLLGGLRVTEHMDELGIFHATLAQLFFVLVCAIALFTSKWWERLSQTSFSIRPAKNLRSMLVVTSLLILTQLILGATMRHQHAGLAIPDFPLAYGKLWPAMDDASVARYNQQRMEITALNPITAPQIGLQMAHRLLAIATLVGVVYCAWSARRRRGANPILSNLTMIWMMLILMQVLLGAATIWSNKAADMATAHVLIGALSLATGAIGCIVSFRMLGLGREISNIRSSSRTIPEMPFRARPSAATGME